MQRFGGQHPGHQPAAAAGRFGGPTTAPYGRNAGIAFPHVANGPYSIYPSLSEKFFATRFGGTVRAISPAQRTASLVLRGGD